MSPLAHEEIWGLSFDCIEGEVDASLVPCISYKCMGEEGGGGGYGGMLAEIGSESINLSISRPAVSSPLRLLSALILPCFTL